MPSTYSPNLRVELIGTGEQSGTWGSTTNNNLGTILESAICGYVAVTVSGTAQALTALNGVEDQSRNMVIDVYGSLTDDFVLYIPPAEKYYVIRNNTTQTTGKTFKVGAATTLNGTTSTGGTQVTIPSKASSPYNSSLVFCDTTNVSEALTYVNNLTAGSLTLTTRLPETSGGVPAQSGFGSCFLTTDGTNAYWSGTGIKTVKVATTSTSGTAGNITLSGLTSSPIDNIALADGMRILVKNQSTTSDNGIWVVNAGGAWTRAADANTAGELAGSIVNVQSGDTNGGTQWATSFKDAGSGITANTWNSVVPLPAQTGNASKVLTTDGTTASWASPAAKTVRVATTSTELNISVNGSAPNSVDGVSLALNDRILVKNQVTNPAQNGIYYVTTVGTGTNGVWARAADANSAADIAGSAVIVQAGTTNGGTQWVTTFTSANTLGSTAMTWNQVLTGTVPTTKGGTNLTTYTKGDILYSDATNSLAKLPISTTNNWVLTADTATGLPKWAAPTGGGSGVTQVNAGNGMSFSSITSTGSVAMGSPSSVSTSSTNGFPTSTTHTHTLDTNGLVLTTAFTGSGNQSIGTNGYQKLPGGLILQWGVLASGGQQTISFSTAPNITFPTACYSLVVTPTATVGNAPVGNSPTITALSASSATVYLGASANGAYWVAYGK